MVDRSEWQPRRVTLDDVARRAEVSRALVSIVMREVPGASAATRERVLAAARELGYRPDLRARSLAGVKSKLIGVIFGVGVGMFHFDLLDGLYAAAERHGHGLVLTPLTHSRDEAQAAQSLSDFGVDAVVMLGPPTTAPLLAGQVPTVVIGWHVESADVDVVRTSDAEGMELAVAHLVALGHRRIAHLDGGGSLIGASRRDEYVRAMGEAGLDAVRIVPGGPTFLDGQRAAAALLADEPFPTDPFPSAPFPTAMIAYNDDTATAALGVFAQAGLDVPGRISVVGWDDAGSAVAPYFAASAASAGAGASAGSGASAASRPTTIAPLTGVGLTSVAQDPAELARLAIDRAVDRIERRRIADREIILHPSLTIRTSTGPAPAER